jgi:hypothetical protein
VTSRMWLVRHPDHTFSRPMPESVLIEKIEKGAFGRQDEICVSTGYWVSLSDAVEVRKLLGAIRLNAISGRNTDSSTATDTFIGTTASVVPRDRDSDGGFVLQRPLGDSAAERSSRGNPFFMVFLLVLFLYTLFLIWRHSG